MTKKPSKFKVFCQRCSKVPKHKDSFWCRKCIKNNEEEYLYLVKRNLWYDKLKEAKFDDIEVVFEGRDNSYTMLRDSASSDSALIQRAQNNKKQAYFEKCKAFLNEYNFHNKKHKRIWKEYSDGLTPEEISNTIGKWRGKKKHGELINHNTIRWVIDKYQAELKKWKPKHEEMPLSPEDKLFYQDLLEVIAEEVDKVIYKTKKLPTADKQSEGKRGKTPD